MSVETHLTSPLRRTPQSPLETGRRRRTAGPIIVACVVAGAVTALVLALVAFAGGSEATITGVILLGFGLGWALMAVLTVRYTREPQRWAAAPAAAMGASGAALVALTPGNEAMTALNWVWPPLLVALAAWMLLQIRRSVHGVARWVLGLVVVLLACASVGATLGNVALAADSTADNVPGTLYDVGGRRLHLDCRGSGSPTAVLSNGLGGVSAGWARITEPLTRTTRVCAYDRAGQGWSDDADSPRDGLQSAEDLHTALAMAGEPGPYVLVGHSTGGTYAMTYAARYPQQVAGLVLLDSSSPEQFSRMPAYAGQYALVRRGLALLPTLRRLGLGLVVPPASHLPAAEADTVKALTSTARAARNQRDEWSVIPDVFTQASALTTLHDRPVAVLTASDNVKTDGWLGAQRQLATLSSNRVHRTVNSTHAGLLDDARPAAESVRAITEVISSVRSGTALGTR